MFVQFHSHYMRGLTSFSHRCFESNKHLMLVTDACQRILDTGAGFLAREMFYFDISVFNGIF